jgi:hypothetical protein
MQQKRRAMPMRGVDKGRIDTATIVKLEQAKCSPSFHRRRRTKSSRGPDSPRYVGGADISMRDIDRALRWANQSGITEQAAKPPPNSRYERGDRCARQGTRQGPALFVSIVSAWRPDSTFADDGLWKWRPNGAKQMQAWNRLTVPASCLHRET